MKHMKRNLALCHYETKHGTDTIVFLTDVTDICNLPVITNKMLEEAGVAEPDVEGAEAEEEASWYNLFPVGKLPELPAQCLLKCKCVVACVDANGTPAFCPVIVQCTEAQYALGEHYDTAEAYAKENDYENPMLVYEEVDGLAWLFQRFDWDSAPVA